MSEAGFSFQDVHVRRVLFSSLAPIYEVKLFYFATTKKHGSGNTIRYWLYEDHISFQISLFELRPQSTLAWFQAYLSL